MDFQKSQNFLLLMDEITPLCQTALEQSYNAIVITDADLNNQQILYANPAFVEMSGYDLEELIGKSPKILQGPLTDKKVIDRLRECLINGEYFEGSTVNYSKHGVPYQVEWNISPVKDPEGNTRYFISFQKSMAKLDSARQ
jgi:PAS domain S-box-containing protein